MPAPPFPSTTRRLNSATRAVVALWSRTAKTMPSDIPACCRLAMRSW